MYRNNRFLTDKLRYAKRTTTKREFNFIPINPESGDAPNKEKGETEQTFALSPPKWASSPRDTPSGSQKKRKKLLVDISLIEPISGLKVSEPKQSTEQEDPTINLAALRAAELKLQKPSTEGKAFPKGFAQKSSLKLTTDSKNKDSNEEESEKASPNIQSAKKNTDSKAKEAETNSDSTTKTKSSASKISAKKKSSSDNDSEESGRKSRQSSRRSNNSDSSEVFKSRRSRNGSRSSRVEESESEIPKTSKVSLYKNFKESKESGGSTSEGFSSKRKLSETEDKVQTIRDEKVATIRKYTRRLSESRKSGRESGTSPDEDCLTKGKRVNKKSRDSVKRSTDDDLSRANKAAQVFTKSEDLVIANATSAQKRKSSSSEKSTDGMPSKIRKSSDSGLANKTEKSITGQLTIKEKPVTRASSSEKSDAEGQKIKAKPITRASSSEKSDTEGQKTKLRPLTIASSSEKSDAEGQKIKAKLITKASSSEKSDAEGRKIKAEPITRASSSEKSDAEGRKIKAEPITRANSSEKSDTEGQKIKLRPLTRASSSEKSDTEGQKIKLRPLTRASSSEKSDAEGQKIKSKPITRVSSSEKSDAEGQKIKSKPITRVSSSEKSDVEGRKIKAKPITRVSSSEKSDAEGRKIKARPITTRVSSSEKIAEVTSLKTKDSSTFKKSAHEIPSTSGIISHTNDKSEISAGEGPSKPQKVYEIFRSKSYQSKPTKYKETQKFASQVFDIDFSSDDQLFSPQKLNVSRQQITSKKGAKFKKTTKSKHKKITSQSSSDEQLFKSKKSKVYNRKILSDRKSRAKIVKSQKVDSAKLNKDKLKKSLENLSKLHSQQTYRTSHSESDSEEISSSVKSSKKSRSKKKPEDIFQDISGEMSEEIPLQDKPVITTFAGLPLSDSEKYSTEENTEDEETLRLEESKLNLENIFNSNKVKLKKIFDTSQKLKVNLLQPHESGSKQCSVTHLDILWNFLEKTLHTIIKESEDTEKRKLLKIMKSSLEEQFLNAKQDHLQKKEMYAVLKYKSEKIKSLTDELLNKKQKNRQLSYRLYEKECEKPPPKQDAILHKFEEFCQSFAQFKRN